MTSRKPNAWLEAALKFGQTHDSFVAIDPRSTPKSWCAWRDYFRWLNWAPFWFLEVERKHDEHRESGASWTAPTDHPDQFTVAFQPIHGNPPVFPLTLPKTYLGRPPVDERCAHVQRVLGPGSKFPVKPIANRSGWITPESAAEILARYEREAQQQQRGDEELL